MKVLRVATVLERAPIVVTEMTAHHDGGQARAGSQTWNLAHRLPVYLNWKSSQSSKIYIVLTIYINFINELNYSRCRNPVTGKIDALSKPRPLKDCLGTGKDSRASPIATSSAKKRNENVLHQCSL